MKTQKGSELEKEISALFHYGFPIPEILKWVRATLCDKIIIDEAELRTMDYKIRAERIVRGYDPEDPRPPCIEIKEILGE